MTIRVKIDYIGAQGNGVAEGPDGPVYVPFSVDGDELEIKLQGKQGRITHIHEPSAKRIMPVCRHFGRCGGCSLQHISQDHYGHWMETQVKQALSHRGFENVTILDVEISPIGSRRRARLSAMGRSGGNVVLGFAERSSHNIIDVTECSVLKPEIVTFIEPLRKFLSGQLKNRQKMNIQITSAENGLDVILEGAGEPDLDLRMDIAAFAEEQDVARICWQDTKLKKPFYDFLSERRKPYVFVADRQVFLPPGSFLQATKEGEIALTRHMKSILAEADKVVDIFAGCGTFTVALIGDKAVHAVEGKEDMVVALKQSSNQMGKIRNLTTEIRDLFLRPLLPHELNKYDGVILDPPRAGARDQVQEIANSDIKNLVMVSCNPATFARDARILVDAGFVMGDILPVDQFLYSPHLELVAGFKRDS
ncbi:MAG: class I SAM-dependent RNA methyltransferase [Emcibacter sp.]|nr:class I SAM-dependent RNA methyltransferase [Emcibacter sp.]